MPPFSSLPYSTAAPSEDLGELFKIADLCGMWPAAGSERELPACYAILDGRPLSAQAFPRIAALVGMRYGRADRAGWFVTPDLRIALPLGADPNAPDTFIGAPIVRERATAPGMVSADPESSTPAEARR